MIFVLSLSMMRDEKYETSDRIVAWSASREALENFVARERVEPWVDENPAMANLNGTYRYHKVFRKGGPLEWFNPQSARYPESIFPILSPEEFAEGARQKVREEPWRFSGMDPEVAAALAFEQRQADLWGAIPVLEVGG